MASRADAWLIHLPGMTRRHEVFTAEQLIQDLSNLDDLVSTVQDSRDDSFSGREKNSLSLSVQDSQDDSFSRCEKNSLCFLFASFSQETQLNEFRNFLSFSYRKLARKENEREHQQRPVLVQIRTQRGGTTGCHNGPRTESEIQHPRTRTMEAIIGKQRQSPLSYWIGKAAPWAKYSHEALRQG